MPDRPVSDLQLLRSGEQFFPALIGQIDQARSEVLLETYIFCADPAGLAVAQALARAAARGVIVQVVVDGYGTRPVPQEIDSLLRRAGVNLRVYSPVPTLITLDRSRLRRLHRKLACVDAQTAFVGGINLMDDLHDPNQGLLEAPRLDYAVRVGHPDVVAEVHLAMQTLWTRLADPPVQRALEAGVDRLRALGRARRRSRPRLQLALRDNLAHRRDIERLYLQAIGRARHEVLIATAYFFPGRRFRRALKMAVQRGVRVRLLLQGRIEYLLPYRAAQALYASLLHGGIEILEYRRSFLHAKVAVIDDWATVGSSNIDPFSLLLAREANVVVNDADFAATLRQSLLQEMQEGAHAIALEHHQRRSAWRRVGDWLAYRVLRLGVWVSGERGPY